MSPAKNRKKILQRKIQKLQRYQRNLKKYERLRRMKIRKLNCAKMAEWKRKRFLERKRRMQSRRETAKLNRTLRRRRKR